MTTRQHSRLRSFPAFLVVGCCGLLGLTVSCGGRPRSPAAPATIPPGAPAEAAATEVSFIPPGALVSVFVDADPARPEVHRLVSVHGRVCWMDRSAFDQLRPLPGRLLRGADGLAWLQGGGVLALDRGGALWVWEPAGASGWQAPRPLAGPRPDPSQAYGWHGAARRFVFVADGTAHLVADATARAPRPLRLPPGSPAVADVGVSHGGALVLQLVDGSALVSVDDGSSFTEVAEPGEVLGSHLAAQALGIPVVSTAGGTHLVDAEGHLVEAPPYRGVPHVPPALYGLMGQPFRTQQLRLLPALLDAHASPWPRVIDPQGATANDREVPVYDRRSGVEVDRLVVPWSAVRSEFACQLTPWPLGRVVAACRRLAARRPEVVRLSVGGGPFRDVLAARGRVPDAVDPASGAWLFVGEGDAHRSGSPGALPEPCARAAAATASPVHGPDGGVRQAGNPAPAAPVFCVLPRPTRLDLAPYAIRIARPDVLPTPPPAFAGHRILVPLAPGPKGHSFALAALDPSGAPPNGPVSPRRLILPPGVSAPWRHRLAADGTVFVEVREPAGEDGTPGALRLFSAAGPFDDGDRSVMREIDLPKDVWSVGFADGLRGLAVGRSLAEVYRTVDAGRRWRRLSMPGVEAAAARTIPVVPREVPRGQDLVDCHRGGCTVRAMGDGTGLSLRGWGPQMAPAGEPPLVGSSYRDDPDAASRRRSSSRRWTASRTSRSKAAMASSSVDEGGVSGGPIR